MCQSCCFWLREHLLTRISFRNSVQASSSAAPYCRCFPLHICSTYSGRSCQWLSFRTLLIFLTVSLLRGLCSFFQVRSLVVLWVRRSFIIIWCMADMVLASSSFCLCGGAKRLQARSPRTNHDFDRFSYNLHTILLKLGFFVARKDEISVPWTLLLGCFGDIFSLLIFISLHLPLWIWWLNSLDVTWEAWWLRNFIMYMRF